MIACKNKYLLIFFQLGTLGAGNHYGEVQVVDEIYDKYAASKMGIDHIGKRLTVFVPFFFH